MRTAELLAYFRRERAWTRQIVAALPETVFDWSPAPEAFSCGELVRHLIQSEVFWRRMLLAGARGEMYDPFGGAMSEDGTANLVGFRRGNLESSRQPRLGTTFAELRVAWEHVEQETLAQLGAIPDDVLTREMVHTIARMHGPLWEMFLVMTGHEVHHRGQLSAYLKTLGIAQPPLYTQQDLGASAAT